MRSGGDAGGDLRPMEEAAIGKENAEDVIALDDEPIFPPSLGAHMRKIEYSTFRKADAALIRPELGRATQASKFTGFEVADATNDGPAAGEKRGYCGQTSGSMIWSKVQGQTPGKTDSAMSVSPSALMTAVPYAWPIASGSTDFKLGLLCIR